MYASEYKPSRAKLVTKGNLLGGMDVAVHKLLNYVTIGI